MENTTQCDAELGIGECEVCERQYTIDTLPRRRGVVMREFGIADSYGNAYIRHNGGLRRVQK